MRTEVRFGDEVLGDRGVQVGSGVVMEAGVPQTGPTSRMPSRRDHASSGETNLTPCLILSFLQVVLNQKFTDCFVLVFLDSHLGKTVRIGVRGLVSA